MIQNELERTFLAKKIPKEVLSAKAIEMVDSYIPAISTDHPTLRLRKKGNYFEITKKEPISEDDYSELQEHTITLNEAEYLALADCPSLKVEKLRFQVYINEYQAEVDIFKGALTGLVLINFEFATNDEKQAFLTPDICLHEVTQEEWCAGGILAGKSFKDIAPFLSSLGYEPIFD
jgi:CYTH domain-containing protein